MGRSLAWVAVVLLIPGCARVPAPLPPAMPQDLPAAWLAPMRASDSPAPFRAAARVDVQTPGRVPVLLDGALEWGGGGMLRFHGGYGRFRPVFALAADGDTAQLLLQAERIVWCSGQGAVDWAGGNPSAWAAALVWAVDPARFLREFEPRGSGTLVDGLWVLDGRVSDAPGPVRVAIDPRRRTLRSIELSDPERVVASLDLSEHTRWGDAWLPTRIRLELRAEEFRVDVELRDFREPRRPGAPFELAHPPGWRRLRRGETLRFTSGMALPQNR